jgi:hypothetical protein
MKTSSSKGSFSRRLRKLLRSAEAPLGFNDLPDLDDMVGVLCHWAASLPWVSEVRGPVDGEEERCFTIDCPPLVCSGPWFGLRVYGHDLDNGPEVLVVLPDRVAHRGVALGWATDAREIGRGRSTARLALPTTPPELAALQRLLMIAYSTAFPGTGEGGRTEPTG